jgi:hypothetical protein
MVRLSDGRSWRVVSSETEVRRIIWKLVFSSTQRKLLDMMFG